MTRTKPLEITVEQYYADAPIALTLEQTRTAGRMTKVVRETFVVDRRDALRLVAILAPLAGRVLDRRPRRKGAAA